MEQRPFVVSGLLILSLFVYGTLVVPQASEIFFNSGAPIAAVGAAPVITAQPLSQSLSTGNQFEVHVDVTSSLPTTYRWYRNGQEITGWNLNLWYVANVTVAADAGQYYVVVSNSAGSVTSQTATITIDGKSGAAVSAGPTITDGPWANTPRTTDTAVTVTSGTDYLYIFTTATGSGTLHYQWYHDTAKVGSDEKSYWDPAVSAASAGQYWVVVTDANGSVTSRKVSVTVTGATAFTPTVTAPVVTTQPSGQSLDVGGTISLSVGVSGTSPFSYQWLKNGAAILNQVASVLSITNAQTSDAGSYSVKVSNSAGVATSNAATVVVTTPAVEAPVITNQLTASTASNTSPSVTLTPGVDYLYIFMGVSSIEPVTYKWYHNGVLMGITTPTVWYNPAQVADLGEYYAVVSNSGGSVSTNKVTAAAANQVPTPAPFVPAPTITTQPVSQTITVGGAITLSVVASGTAPLSYQWYKGSSALSGKTSSTLTIVNAKTSNAGQYYVKVSNASGSVTSDKVSVTIVKATVIAPTITTQPVSQTITVGGAITLSVVASGTAPISYQWYKNGIALSGQTSSTFTLANAQTTNSGSYTVKISNSAGTVTSTAATVTVNTVVSPPGVTAPSFVAQPVANTPKETATTVTINPGNDYLYIFMTVAGTAPITYQWYRNGVLMPGATGDTLWYNPATTAEAGTYYVIASNSAGSAKSNPVLVNMLSTPVSPPSITSISNSASVAVGSVASISVTAAGTIPLTYQWYRNGVAIAGKTTSGLVFTSFQSADAGNYTVTVSNSAGSVTSGIITLSVSTTSTPPIVGTNKPLIGACGSCDHLAGVQSFESIIGRKEDYVLAWGWADTMNNFQYAVQYIDQEWPATQYYLEWDMPMIVQGTTFNQTINGVNDAGYLAWARRIVARDPNARVRIGHEQNGNWYDWSQDGPAGTAAEFAAAYRHIVTVMRTVAPNLKFVFNPGAGKWAGIDWLPTYPGDAYVDYISYDMYEDGPWLPTDPDARWTHFLDNDGRGLTFLADFAAQHGKKIGFDEWGTNIDDGTFIKHMYEWMSTHNVAYQMYWDSNAAFSGKLINQPTNLAVFKALFGK